MSYSLQNYDEDWMTYDYHISTCFKHSDFSTISKDHFKCSLFSCGLQEFCQSDVLRMNKSYKITLEDLASEQMKLDCQRENESVQIIKYFFLDDINILFCVFFPFSLKITIDY